MSNKNIQQSKITVEKNNVIGRIGQNLFGAFLEHVGRAIYTGIYEPEHPTANKDGFEPCHRTCKRTSCSDCPISRRQLCFWLSLAGRYRQQG